MRLEKNKAEGTAKTPAQHLERSIGKIIPGSTDAVKPKCAPSIGIAEAVSAEKMIFPLPFILS